MTGPITFGLGIAIAKAAFKGWFAESEFLGSLSDSVAELVGKAVPDWKASSAARRQVERAGEKAAEALLPLIEQEWRDLPSGEKTESIYQVQKAIDELGLNTKILSSIDYDSVTLSTMIGESVSDQMLNADAKQLARRLSSEAAQIIIDLSSSFPTFHRDTYSEILRRESQISEAVDRLFAELESIRRQAAQTEDSASSEFEQNYRRAVIRKLDRIELFGLNATTRTSTRQHSLSTAYISLSVSGLSRESPDEDEAGSSRAVPNAPSSPGSLAPLRAEEATSIAERVVIKGEAGSGKTTLLQSLAVRCAAGTFDDPSMAEWNGLVPFFIPLRALTSSGLPQPETFPSLVTPIIAGTMPPKWVHDQLSKGRGLILIDGLDEISEAKRDATRAWVSEIIGTYLDLRVVISSRPPAIPDGWLTGQGFAELELLPMSPLDVAMFIDHWHEAVAQEEQDADASKQVMVLAPTLRERIRSDRSLRELAATPLLCAMLCAMNRDRKEVLPSNRIALYDAATQMILHGRDEQRQVRVDDLPSLDFETKRDLLQDIALWMMENNLSMAEDWRVEELVARVMPRFPKLERRLTAKLIVKALVHRSGILRSPMEGQCDFIHNAFKEFLCARAVSEADKFGFLLNSVPASEAWREVAPIAAAITDDRRRTAFLEELIKKGDSVQSRRAMYHLLAVRCLETCTQLNPDIQRAIRERLQRLKPPRSMSEAKSLSAAGDLATDLVRKRGSQHARTAAACVRTLRLIGSDKALEQLEPFGSDWRGTVVKELIAAWPFFDRRDYARRVLSQSKGLWGGLRFDSLSQMEGVGELKTLEKLTVYAPRSPMQDWHYSELAGLDSLTYLSLDVSGLVDVKNLESLSRLSTLLIDSNDLTGFEALSEFDALSTLSINASRIELGRMVDLSRLYSIVINAEIAGGGHGLEVGERLSVFFAPHPGNGFDITFLRDASRVERLALPLDLATRALPLLPTPGKLSALFLYNCDVLDNLSIFNRAARITTLWLFEAGALSDLRGVDSFARLQELRISGAVGLRSLDPLSSCKELTSLHIDGLASDVDVSILLTLPKLSNITAPAAIVSQLKRQGVRAHLRSVR